MERLSKSERIGLLAFASVALIFILVSYFLDKKNIRWNNSSGKLKR